jgi:hypothetical protein
MEACCCWGLAIGQGRYDDAIGEKQRDAKGRMGDGRAERGEDATMRNESKDHRKDANMYSIDCRTGEKSSGSSGLERGRRDKAGESIVNEDGLV